MENEIWKDVLGYEGLYQVSDFGNVKRLERIYKCGHVNGTQKNKLNECILKTHFNGEGRYLAVWLSKNKIYKLVKVHRIVWESFNGRTNLQIDHINGNKIDNRLINLQPLNCRDNISKFRLTTNKSSKYIGVSKYATKWRARIFKGKICCELGKFKNEIDAHQAYKNALQHLKVAELTIGV